MDQEKDQESADKVTKEFNGVVKTLIAVLGSKEALNATNKVPADQLGTIVSDLLKEEKEKNAKEVSDGLKALLKGHQELKQEVAKKVKELEQLEAAKMKEFTKQARALFARMEAIGQKERDFYAGLQEATSSEEASK